MSLYSLGALWILFCAVWIVWNLRESAEAVALWSTGSRFRLRNSLPAVATNQSSHRRPLNSRVKRSGANSISTASGYSQVIGLRTGSKARPVSTANSITSSSRSTDLQRNAGCAKSLRRAPSRPKNWPGCLPSPTSVAFKTAANEHRPAPARRLVAPRTGCTAHARRIACRRAHSASASGAHGRRMLRTSAE